MYENLDEDPMLMLERDESPSTTLRIGLTSKKEEKKKTGGFLRKMTYQPVHNHLDESAIYDS